MAPRWRENRFARACVCVCVCVLTVGGEGWQLSGTVGEIHVHACVDNESTSKDTIMFIL